MDRPGRWVVGPVYTGRRWVESFVVEDGTVVSVGERRATRRDRSAGTERTDVRRGLVVPGLVDPHVHPVQMTLLRAGVDLAEARSVQDLLDRVRAWSVAHPEGVILGRGWDHERFRERRYPTAQDLEHLPGDRPVLLFRVCSHVAVLNRAALDAVGIRGTEHDPPGGRIGRHADGSPNGLLFDAALGPVAAFVEEQVLAWPGALASTLQDAVAAGVTTLAPMNVGPAEVRWGFTEARARRLPVRLRPYVALRYLESLPDLRKSPEPLWTRVPGVKVLLDGSFGAHTAWLREPYADRPQEHGLSMWEMEALASRLTSVVDQGWGVAIHAIGDAALDQCLRWMEQRPRVHGVRIEHAALTPPDLLDRLSRLRPDLVVQPGFVSSDTWIANRLGPERARWTYAFRSFLDRSLRVAGSSDAPVEPLRPLEGIRAAVERAAFRRAFEPSAPPPGLTPVEALRMYSASAGEVLGEQSIGTLEPGSVADWVVLTGASLDTALLGPRAGIRETWIDGELRYRRGTRAHGSRAPKL